MQDSVRANTARVSCVPTRIEYWKPQPIRSSRPKGNNGRRALICRRPGRCNRQGSPVCLVKTSCYSRPLAHCWRRASWAFLLFASRTGSTASSRTHRTGCGCSRRGRIPAIRAQSTRDLYIAGLSMPKTGSSDDQLNAVVKAVIACWPKATTDRALRTLGSTDMRQLPSLSFRRFMWECSTLMLRASTLPQQPPAITHRISRLPA